MPRRADIERIVRSVLAEISQPNRTAPTAEGATGELVLTAKVVSLAEVEDRLQGVSRLVVPRGAVLTPAARDELRRHRVAIASAAGVKATARRSVILAVAETNYNVMPLAATLSTEGVTVERCAKVDLVGAIGEMCEIVTQQDKPGLFVTGQSAAALCLANRRRGVRAALGTSVPAVVDAQCAIAANVLVVDPTGKSVFELREIARTFTRGHRSEYPSVLKPFLD